ncbi:transporter [Streptomyces laurentii]|uniref:transporter n=1 Tax=Streptomyces laurentii TaxID=39478 RepID=UPI0036C92FE5
MFQLRLFQAAHGDVREFTPRLAEAEADVQRIVEANMEALLGVQLLASEYGTGPVHAGRIDSLGLDANGAPVVIEYKRGRDSGVINQGLFYLSWLVDHRAEFEYLVRERLGAAAAAQVFWSGPRLICVAGDYTRYDLHAVREHRRSIDLVRYRLFGRDLIGLEAVATAGGRPVQGRPEQRTRPARSGCERIAELAKAADEVLLSLGDGITKVQRKQYSAYRRLQNFASLCPPQRTKVHVYLSLDPAEVDLVPDFTRNVMGLGHHGTGDVEVRLRTERDLERAHDLFRASYAAA